MSDVRLVATNPEDSSIVPGAVNAKGQLLLEDPLTVEGPEGPQGPEGPKGDDGKDGAPGADGNDGDSFVPDPSVAPNAYVLTTSNGTAVWAEPQVVIPTVWSQHLTSSNTWQRDLGPANAFDGDITSYCQTKNAAPGVYIRFTWPMDIQILTFEVAPRMANKGQFKVEGLGITQDFPSFNDGDWLNVTRLMGVEATKGSFLDFSVIGDTAHSVPPGLFAIKLNGVELADPSYIDQRIDLAVASFRQKNA